MKWSLFFSLTGMALSLYALHVENHHQDFEEGNFRSACDIEPFTLLGFTFPKSSCSEVFNHPAGRVWSYLGIIPKESVLDQPNALYGFVYYVIIFFTSLMKNNIGAAHVALFFGLFSVLLSGYLAYILAFVMKHMCVLCVSTYVCNSGIFFDAYANLKALRQAAKEKKERAKAT